MLGESRDPNGRIAFGASYLQPFVLSLLIEEREILHFQIWLEAVSALLAGNVILSLRHHVYTLVFRRAISPRGVDERSCRSALG